MATPGERQIRQRWQYRTTWMRASEEGDEKQVEKHLDQRADAGWELVSANAVQMLLVRSELATYGYYAIPYSTSVVRHYFYWRRPVEIQPADTRKPVEIQYNRSARARRKRP